MKNQNLSFIDNRKSLSYAIYMMGGSYFKSCKCMTPILLEKLDILYWINKPKNQYFLEDAVIRYFEKYILPEFPDMEKYDTEVYLSVQDSSGQIILCFEGYGFRLTITGFYSSKGCRFWHNLEKEHWFRPTA